MPPIKSLIVVGGGSLLFLAAAGVGMLFLYQTQIKQHRYEAANRLKTIGLATHYHHDLVKQFPSNGTTDHYEWRGQKAGGVADAKRPHAGSWAYRLLPLLEMKHDPTFRFPFPDLETIRKLATIYHCPQRNRPLYANGEDFQGGPFTDFVLNPYINDPEQGSVNKPHQRSTLMGITDGASNTILFGHGWISTDDLRNATPGDGRYSIYLGGTNGTARSGKNLLRDTSGTDHYNDWGSPYGEGALMCMADGSVRLFAFGIGSGLFYNFLHPRDGARPDLPPIEPTDDSRFQDVFR